MYVALDELCLLNECLHSKGGDVSKKVKFSPENEKLILNRFTLRTDDPFVFMPKTWLSWVFPFFQFSPFWLVESNVNIVIVYNASVSKFGMDTCCMLLSLGVCKKVDPNR